MYNLGYIFSVKKFCPHVVLANEEVCVWQNRNISNFWGSQQFYSQLNSSNNVQSNRLWRGGSFSLATLVKPLSIKLKLDESKGSRYSTEVTRVKTN